MTKIYILNSLNATLNEKQRNKLTELEAALQDFGSKTTIQYFHSLSGFMNIFVCEIPKTNHKGRFILKRFNDRDYLLVDTDDKHNYNQNRLHKIETTMYSKEDMQPLNDEEQESLALTQAGHDINTAENAARISSIPAKLLGNKIVTPTQTQFNVSQNICEFLLGSKTNIFSLVEGVAGSGKTLIIQDAITSLANATQGIIRKILYLAPTQELANKMIETIKNSVNGELPGFIEVKTFEQADQAWELKSDAEKNSIYIIKDEAQRDFSILSKAAGYLYLGDDNQVGQNQAEIPDFIGKTYKSFLKEMVSRYNSDSDFAENLNATIINIANQLATKGKNDEKVAQIYTYLQDPVKFQEVMRNASSQGQFESYCTTNNICKNTMMKAIYQAIQTICNVTLLHTSIRCPHDINDLAESLLKLRTNEHGKLLKSGILTKSADTVQDGPHEYNIYTADLTKLAASKNIHDAHIVFTEEDKKLLENKSFLNVFTAQECAGLEFANVYLHINAGTIDRIFKDTKQAQLLLAQLYTAITRATDKLIISTSFLNITEKSCQATTCINKISKSQKTLKASQESSKEEIIAHTINLTVEGKNDQAIQNIQAIIESNDLTKINDFFNKIKIIASTEKSNIEKITALQAIQENIKGIKPIDQFIKIYEQCSPEELIAVIKLNSKQFINNITISKNDYIADKLDKVIEKLDDNDKISFLQSGGIYENYTNLYNKLFDSLPHKEKIQLFCSSLNNNHILSHDYYKNNLDIKELISSTPDTNLNNLITNVVNHGVFSLQDIQQLARSEEFLGKMSEYQDIAKNLALPNVKKDYKKQYIHDLIQNSPADEVSTIIVAILESTIFNLKEIYNLIENISDVTKKDLAFQCFFEKRIEDIKLEDYKEILAKLSVTQFTPVINRLVDEYNFELLNKIPYYASKEVVSYINNQTLRCVKQYFSTSKDTEEKKLKFFRSLDIETKKYCIQQKMQIPDLTEQDKQNMLHAIEKGNISKLKSLIAQDPRIVNVSFQFRGVILHPIQAAVQKNNIEIVELLISNGADLNTQTNQRFTALIYAANNNYTKILDLLISKNADLNIQNDQGFTALIAAAHKCYIETSKLLILKGADLNIQNNEGFTALTAAISNGSIETAKLLITNGADLNIQTDQGFTALTEAISKDYVTIAEFLLQYNPDLDIKNDRGITALIDASMRGYTGIVKLLLEKNPNVNLQDDLNYTALIVAASNGYTEIVKLLLEKNPDLNLQNEQKFTALTAAISNNHIDIAKLLLEKNPDLNLQTCQGVTALDIARDRKQLEIIGLIEGKQNSTTPLAKFSVKETYRRASSFVTGLFR